MTEFTLARRIETPYEETVAKVRAGLTEAGFGVLTEIDLAATLKAKLDVEIRPQLILGACRPQLAHKAVEADPRIAAMLPCNVVVADEGEVTRVEIFDPKFMTAVAESDELHAVAADARERLANMLARL